MRIAFVTALSVLLGLLLFLFNLVRRSPGKRLRISLVAIIFVLGAIAFYGFLVEPGRLVTNQQTIVIDNWPPSLDGLRIAVLSDIHADDWFIDQKKLRTIVERTNQLEPEVIVILGDYMSSNGYVKRRVEPEVLPRH
jgi:uncharacterized protein